MSTTPEGRPAPDERPEPGLDVNTWLESLGALLPAGTLGQIGPDDRAALLDLARVAAHQSHRTAAPISTYLVGLAFAALPRPERLARIREIVARLEADAG